MTVLHDLWQDARFYHQLRFPGLQPTCMTWVQMLIGSPGLLVVAVHRLAYCYYSQRRTNLVKLLFFFPLRLGNYLSRVIVKCHVVSSTLLAPGVYLSNRGHIILGARKIGSGTIIHDRVTIGMNPMNKGIPEIGRNVWIGPDTVLNGNINIGDGVTVLPGTVLTKSLPPGVVVQGNPARIVKRDFDNSKLLRICSTDIGSLVN